ncbi:MAG: hypothetical protein ACFCVF_09970 [Kineosporiaceae bacterium]
MTADEPGTRDATGAHLVEAARTAAGVLAARARGDADGVRRLLVDLPDPQTRAVAFLMIAELSVTLLASVTDSTPEEVAGRLGIAVTAGLAT